MYVCGKPSSVQVGWPIIINVCSTDVHWVRREDRCCLNRTWLIDYLRLFSYPKTSVLTKFSWFDMILYSRLREEIMHLQQRYRSFTIIDLFFGILLFAILFWILKDLPLNYTNSTKHLTYTRTLHKTSRH